MENGGYDHHCGSGGGRILYSPRPTEEAAPDALPGVRAVWAAAAVAEAVEDAREAVRPVQRRRGLSEPVFRGVFFSRPFFIFVFP